MINRLLVALSAIALLVGCGSSQNAEEISLTENTVIIDVRTPAEFAEGHVDGAINLDLESGQFEAELPNLDATLPYIVYCRSGRRSGVAAELMRSNGFSQVTDFQTLENAANKTGLSVVQ